MKKLVLLSIMIGIVLTSFGQATPSKIVRVAARTTTFDVNLPAGTQIYVVADSTNWNVLAAGVASTRTINTAWAAGEIQLIHTTVQNQARRDSTYAVTIDSTKATQHELVIGAATTDYAGVMLASDKVKLDGISASSGTAFSETFEASADSLAVGTFQGYYTFSLTETPKDSLAFTVSLNGVELRHHATGQYRVLMPTLAAKKLLVYVPVYKYDVLSVSYTK